MKKPLKPVESEEKSGTFGISSQEKIDLWFEQNFKVYMERKGVPGIVSWYSVVKEDAFEEKDLMISTVEKYGRVIINGELYEKK